MRFDAGILNKKLSKILRNGKRSLEIHIRRCSMPPSGSKLRIYCLKQCDLFKYDVSLCDYTRRHSLVEGMWISNVGL